MLVIGIFAVLMGTTFLLFRRRVGYVGSRERAFLRKWIPTPEDDAYVLTSAMGGCAALVFGVVVIAIALSK